MPLSNWQYYELGQTGRIVTGKTPPTVDKDNFGGHIPFITPSDLDDRKFISKTQRCVTDCGLQTVKGCFLPKNSVMVSCIGSDMGKVAVNVKPSVTNQQINSIIPNESFFSDFLYYCLKPRKEELQALATSGSAQPILNKGHFSKITIKAPLLPEQRAIAAILGALDDKIELNRRMNATLEAMARALFKSWFVDFDPVRAKMEGKQPFGMDSETAALFPSRLVPSELGDIPAGWSIEKLGEVSRITIGRTPPRKEQKCFVDSPFGTTWLSIRDMAEGSVYAFKSSEGLTIESIEQYRVPIVPQNTVIVSFKLTVGRVALTGKPMATNEAIAHIHIDESPIQSPLYLYCFMKQYDFTQLASTSSIATAVNSESIRGIKVILPDEMTQRTFHNHVKNIFEKISANLQEINKLEKTRDYLLPKLISGEIRISDAEKFVEGM